VGDVRVTARTNAFASPSQAAHWPF
jgi:hypothetical protein